MNTDVLCTICNPIWQQMRTYCTIVVNNQSHLPKTCTSLNEIMDYMNEPEVGTYPWDNISWNQNSKLSKTIYRHRYSWFTNPNWTKATKISYRYPYESNRWRLTRRNGITKCWFPSKNKSIKSPIISKINEIEKFSLKIFTSSQQYYKW